MPKAKKVHYKISNLFFSISLIINGKHMRAGRQKDAYTSGLTVTDMTQRLRTVLICSGGVCKWSHLHTNPEHFLVEMWQVKKGLFVTGRERMSKGEEKKQQSSGFCSCSKMFPHWRRTWQTGESAI